MSKWKLLIISLVLSILTIFIPMRGIGIPMRSSSSILRGYPFMFLELSNPENFKDIDSFFRFENILSINIIGINFLLNTFVIFIVLLALMTLFSSSKIKIGEK